MSLSRKSFTLTALLVLFSAGPTQADDRGSDLLSIIDFQAFYQHYDIDLDYEDEVFESTIDKVGIIFFEQTSRYVQGGLTFGWMQISQDDNPTMQGFTPWGGFAGLALRSDPVNTERSRVRVQGEYAYHWADKSTDTQDTEFRWHQWTLDLSGTLKFSQAHFTVGGRAQWLDGDEDASGDITSKRDFEQKDLLSGYAGIDLITMETGRIGLYGETGAREGFTIVFGREF